MMREPAKAFKSSREWRQWLLKNHAKSTGLWVRIYKKDSDKKTVTYAEALEEALCFGWIDGQRARFDNHSFLQRFTPRRPKSMWSKRNREHARRLIKEKRMTAAGHKEIDAAKKDGRWERAYDPASTMKVPADFLKELRKDKAAYEFFKTLNKANVYAIAWRLQSAKRPETRERRKEVILAMLKGRERFH